MFPSLYNQQRAVLVAVSVSGIVLEFDEMSRNIRSIGGVRLDSSSFVGAVDTAGEWSLHVLSENDKLPLVSGKNGFLKNEYSRDFFCPIVALMRILGKLRVFLLVSFWVSGREESLGNTRKKKFEPN